MKTTLHTYNYDTNNPKHFGPDGEWTKLAIMLEHTPGRGHKMHSLKDKGFEPDPGEIELEPECLFQNQWNSNVGRVFDWYEEAVFGPYREMANIKRGHYLDITPEMIAIRKNTLKCGYTGMQFPIETDSPLAPVFVFNTTLQALGSPYLKESELYLLRLLPVCDEFVTDREPLTEEERAYLLPLYIQAQTKTNGNKRVKQTTKIKADYERAVSVATTERDGFLWLLENGVSLENCIFYEHTGRFGFGWRSPYPEVARAVLLEALAKFPYPYDVK